MISSLFKEGEGDARWGGIRRGNDNDEDVGECVIACCADRNMCKWMGSSPLSTVGGRGPVREIA